MNTFLKVLLCVVAAVIALKLLPFLLFPIMAGGFAILVVAGLVLGGVMAFAGAGIAVITTLLLGVIALLAVSSPLWIPVLLVVGLVALICRIARAS